MPIKTPLTSVRVDLNLNKSKALLPDSSLSSKKQKRFLREKGDSIFPLGSRKYHTSNCVLNLQERTFPECKENNTNIVVWGTNLESGVGKKKRISYEVARMFEFPPYQHSVIIGLLLSDG